MCVNLRCITFTYKKYDRNSIRNQKHSVYAHINCFSCFFVFFVFLYDSKFVRLNTLFADVVCNFMCGESHTRLFIHSKIRFLFFFSFFLFFIWRRARTDVGVPGNDSDLNCRKKKKNEETISIENEIFM